MATSSSVCFPFPLSVNLDLFFLSKIFLRSLSNFNFTISTLLGWMPTLTVAPFALSRWILSMWMTHFFRYVWITFPTVWLLWWPRVTWTSSSFRMGKERTLYFCRRSLHNGALMSFLRTLDGAVKWALRLFRREELTFLLYFIFFTTFPRWRTEPKRTIPQGAARSKCDVSSTSLPNGLNLFIVFLKSVKHKNAKLKGKIRKNKTAFYSRRLKYLVILYTWLFIRKSVDLSF